MGRGSLVSLHRQLLLRFDSVTQRSGVNTFGGEQLERLDDCSSRFRAWSEQIGVRNSALDVLERHGSGYKNTIIRLFDGIYIRLRVVGNLMKEAETAGSDREDEARAAVVGIIKDMDSLEEQVADIQSFLERLSGHGSVTELQEPEQAYDSDDSQVRHVSNSTANTGTVSWTTTIDSTDHEPMAAPITPKARKTAKTPKTPQTQIISDKHTRSAPTSPGTASSVKTHNPEWEEEWDPEFVIAALSASESHASFTAPIDNENYADAKGNVNDNGIDDSLAAAPAHRIDFSKPKSTSASSPPAAESTHLYHPANTTWIEDTSSNLKEGDSEEWTKAQTRLASKSTTSKSSPALRSDYQHDYEQFRKQVSSRMRLLEKLNRSLSRKIEELESGIAASEGNKRDVIEQYVKKKGGQEAWEKSIREAAVDEYKDSLRAEEYRELECRKMLKHETRLIEKRAQREMSEIYQQSGLQVHEAALRHHDEVFQIQQRLTSELLTIERRIQEQIQAKLWSLPTRPLEDRVEKGKGRRVSFEPREQRSTEQPDRPAGATQKKSLQVPSYRESGGSEAARQPSEGSHVAPEAPQPTLFASDMQNIHPAERHPSTDYRPIAAVAPWERRDMAHHDPETSKANLKRSSTTASKFRRLARALRLKPVARNDINLVKVSKSTRAFPDRTEATTDRRMSIASFLSRCRRNSSIKHTERTASYGDTANPVPELPAAAQSTAVQPPAAPLSYYPTEHPAAPPPQRILSPPFHAMPTPPRHPPFSFQLNVPPGSRGSTWPPLPLQATKMHKSQISPDGLTYYGPWEWDRVSPLIAAATAACAAREQQQHHRRSRRRHHSSHHHHSSSNNNEDTIGDPNTPTPASRHTKATSHSHKHHRHHSSTPTSASLSSPFTTASSSTQSPNGSSNSNHVDKYWPALSHLSSLPFRAHYY